MKRIGLTLCQGIQCSGKSTWAKEVVSEYPELIVRVNDDDIRRMLGAYWAPSREPLVNEIKLHTIKSALEMGYDVIVDNMNLDPDEIATYQHIIDELNSKSTDVDYVLTFKKFATHLEECIKRDSEREYPIGEKVIRSTHKEYKKLYDWL